VIVGADGATSRVADVARLVDAQRVLWGFAVRAYYDLPIDLPHIVFWTPNAGAAFPGYGWAFPAGHGAANIGLGVGVLADRSAARRAARDLDAFVAHASRIGIVDSSVASRLMSRPLGGWLKMGIVGTQPAHGRVLLVGDAAGLVNPLQGEGIAQAMESGRAAAIAILGGVDNAADRYRAHLAARHAGYSATSASVQRTLLRHDRLAATITRGLTTPGVRGLVAGGWSITWNDLRDGAQPSVAKAVASVAAGLGHAFTVRSADRRWIKAHLSGSGSGADHRGSYPRDGGRSGRPIRTSTPDE
jgi:flavin-dependent dehydrogenase